MTLTTVDGACETLKPISYSLDMNLESSENRLDTSVTIAQIMIYNAKLKELCPSGKPVNLLAGVQ